MATTSRALRNFRMGPLLGPNSPRPADQEPVIARSPSADPEAVDMSQPDPVTGSVTFSKEPSLGTLTPTQQANLDAELMDTVEGIRANKGAFTKPPTGTGSLY